MRENSGREAFPLVHGLFQPFAGGVLGFDEPILGAFGGRKGLSPVMLNLLVPELTRRMIGKIFATHPEDWPAVLRAMRETGEEFREGKISPLPQLRAEGN